MTETKLSKDTQVSKGTGEKAIGVLVIHGMGTQNDTYAEKMTDELKDRLGNSNNHVAWHAVFWANILSNRQQEYLDTAANNTKIDWIRARSFVVSALSDAASYRQIQSDNLNDPKTTYGKIHRRVLDGLKELSKQVRHDGGLVILAHSLGGHIISNYIWDVQSNKVNPKIDRNSYEGITNSLRLLVTFGCNIPLFTFALDKVVPIHLEKGVEWHNYYDRDDVLGYPLQPINQEYEQVCMDSEINVGGFLSSWNLFSHNKYWTDNDFTKPVAELIYKVIRAELKL